MLLSQILSQPVSALHKYSLSHATDIPHHCLAGSEEIDVCHNEDILWWPWKVENLSLAIPIFPAYPESKLM